MFEYSIYPSKRGRTGLEHNQTDDAFRAESRISQSASSNGGVEAATLFGDCIAAFRFRSSFSSPAHAVLATYLAERIQPQEQGTVELLMVEQKGPQKPRAEEPPNSQAAQAKPGKIQAAKSETDAERLPPGAVPAPATTEGGDEPAALQPKPVSTPSTQPDTQSSGQQTAERPAQPATRDAPVFNLEGTESEANAIASGSQILPATPDNRFRNRPPIYPPEAEMRGQHGTVVVLIHVSETGVASGADVLESSGVKTLDQAAVAAVRKWHFHPAMKAGSLVPFDMPFRFVFEPY